MKNLKLVVVGLGSIGGNLSKSLIEKGYNVCVWDKNIKKTRMFCKNLKISFFKNKKNVFNKERKVIILTLPSGSEIDNFILQNLNKLKKNKIILDFGNNHPEDTVRRFNFLKRLKISYLSCGFSGGIEGAKKNASLMISCNLKLFNHLKNLFLDIIGKKNHKFLSRVGSNVESANYTKIIHNGIEYAIMQSIADYYSFLFENLRLKNSEIIDEFNKLKSKTGHSFLIDISRKIVEDSISNQNSLYNILDKVDDNKTGAWASGFAFDNDFPIPLITTSVEARYLSRQKRLFKKYKKKIKYKNLDKIKKDILEVTYLLIFSSYLQGIGLLNAISKNKNININLKNTILSWSNNSIINSELLKKIFVKIKSNRIDIYKIFKNELSLSKNNSLNNILVHLTSNNIILPSVFSFSIWANLLVDKKNISFSFIQKQRNVFGNHKLKFKKK